MAFKYKIINKDFEGRDAETQAEQYLEELSLEGWTLESVRVTASLTTGPAQLYSIRLEAVMSKEKP